jgi:hypothetical protein
VLRNRPRIAHDNPVPYFEFLRQPLHLFPSPSPLGRLVLAICTTESYYLLSHVVSDLTSIRDTRQSTGTGYACLDSR